MAINLTVTKKGETINFDSAFESTSEAIAYVNQFLQWNTFAMDLVSRYSLSEKQRAWVHYLGTENINRQKEKESAADYNFSGLIQMIETAKQNGLKRIKVNLGDYSLKPNKRQAGAYVFDNTQIVEGRYGTGPKYIGWITETNTNIKDEATIGFLQAASKNPLAAAKLHGQQTGNCSCCGRELTNAESIALGIGPICLQKYFGG